MDSKTKWFNELLISMGMIIAMKFECVGVMEVLVGVEWS